LSDLTSAFPTSIVASLPSALVPDILSALKEKVSDAKITLTHRKKTEKVKQVNNLFIFKFIFIDISPFIIYPIIDRLLGGSSADLFIPTRPHTQIEWRLVKRLTDRALSNLSEAWSHITKISFELTETESNPQLVQIVPPNEVVVVICFEIKMGNHVGPMSFCIPYNVIEPVMSKLSQQNWFTYAKRAGDDSHSKAIEKTLSGAPLQVRVLLGQTTIKVNELINLAEGDILQLDKPASGEMLIQVEGRNKFTGIVGQYKSKRALRIKRALGTGDRVG